MKSLGCNVCQMNGRISHIAENQDRRKPSNKCIGDDPIDRIREGLEILVDDDGSTLKIISQDFAGGGESVSIDVGRLTNKNGSIVCIAKTIKIMQEGDALSSIHQVDSNEHMIADIMKQGEISKHLCLPFTHYDRNKAYARSNVSQRLMSSSSKFKFITILSEFINGHDLTKLMKYHPTRLNASLVKDIIKSIWDALKNIHSNRIVNSDIKPSNIMIGDNGEIKLIDFGRASYISETSPKDMDEKRNEDKKILKRIFSTPIYISAAIMKGDIRDIVDRNCLLSFLKLSDIWSYGMVIYEMIALRPYFNEYIKEHPVSIINSLMNHIEKHVSAGNSLEIDPVVSNMMISVDPKILEICKKCLTFYPISIAGSEQEYINYANNVINEIDHLVSSL